MENKKKTYLEYIDETKNINKFWEITIQESKLIIHYGRIGTKGNIKEKTFSSNDETIKEANKSIASKIKKGYQQN